MLDRLQKLEAQYDQLTAQLASPEVTGDSARYQKTARAHAELEPLASEFRHFRSLQQQAADARLMLHDPDPELRKLAADELASLDPAIATSEERLRHLLLPKDPNDDKNVVLEIRAGTGGDEATLFAAEMFRMYSRFAEQQKWRIEVLSTSESGVHGLKEVVAIIEGKGAYSQLKYESGVHRVQRVPATEQQGRVHTSAVTVAVLPEAEEVDIKVDPKDIRTDTFCSSGPGGQSVNTTYSAVRLTHLPTGVIVSCQDEKSQIKNRAKAMRVLLSRLLEIEQEKQHQAIAAERKQQVGSGDRSEKIRTYNFPQNRVTDHRAGLTLHQLADVMDGRLQPLIAALTEHFQAQRLQKESVA